MFPEETRGRQEKLKRFIYELSKEMLSGNEDQIKQFLNRLVGIYADNFKHIYSDFFPVLLKIYEEDNEYNIDYLSNNLDMLGTYLEGEYSNGHSEYLGIYGQFTKLCDHLNLQIGQFNYILSKETSNTRLQEASRNLEESNVTIKESLIKLDESYNKLEESNKRLEESNKKADAIQTEVIAILGIFAAIIIAFSGGLTLLGNSIISICNAKHYESVIMIAIICGMIMFNTIFLMMYFVSKLTEKDVLAICESKVCAQCRNANCKGIARIRKRLPYVYYYNFASLIGIAIDLAVWFLDTIGIIG